MKLIAWDSDRCLKMFGQGFHLLIVSLLLLPSCQGGDATPRPIKSKRTIASPLHQVLPNATAEQRFGNFRPQQPAPRSSLPQLAWDTPEGWVDLGPSSTRQINLRPADNPSAECYVARLPGGGSLEDNVNRWRQQMGQGPLSGEEVTALPQRSLLGAPATFVEITGDFTGMTGETISDARLFGLILLIGDVGLFVKMIGPDALLVAERERFLDFCDSLHLETITPPTDTNSSPHENLTWTAPKGWIVEAPTSMRHFTYRVGVDTECYLSILGGTAGGLEANVNRWRKEIGLPPLATDAIADLATTTLAGSQATVVEGEGTFQGMSGPPRDGFRLLGLIAPASGKTYFLKMVGPSSEVTDHREGFFLLASSIEIVN